MIFLINQFSLSVTLLSQVIYYTQELEHSRGYSRTLPSIFQLIETGPLGKNALLVADTAQSLRGMTIGN